MPPPSTPDPRTMDLSGHCHPASLLHTQCILCRAYFLG
jgi:hypothetical protein